MTDMVINRDIYLNRLIDRKDNPMIKIITGIRRSGKSFLLFKLYYEYLLSIGIKKDKIIRIALDDFENRYLRDANALVKYLDKKTDSNDMYYIFLDEIQHVAFFEGVLNGLNRKTIWLTCVKVK